MCVRQWMRESRYPVPNARRRDYIKRPSRMQSRKRSGYMHVVPDAARGAGTARLGAHPISRSVLHALDPSYQVYT